MSSVRQFQPGLSILHVNWDTKTKMDSERVYRALLNAVFKRDYEDNATLTSEVVKQELGLESNTIEGTNLCNNILPICRGGVVDDTHLTTLKTRS